MDCVMRMDTRNCWRFHQKPCALVKVTPFLKEKKNNYLKGPAAQQHTVVKMSKLFAFISFSAMTRWFNPFFVHLLFSGTQRISSPQSTLDISWIRGYCENEARYFLRSGKKPLKVLFNLTWYFTWFCLDFFFLLKWPSKYKHYSKLQQLFLFLYATSWMKHRGDSSTPGKLSLYVRETNLSHS